LHADGYKLVIRDQTTNFRVVTEAEKGDYEAALFFGASVQLAQAPEVSQIKTNLALMQIDVDSIKGTGFTASDSLHSIRAAVGTPLQAADYAAPPSAASNASAVRAELATELGRIDATVSSRLATAGYTAPANADIAAIKSKTETLQNADLSGVATSSQVTALATAINDVPTAEENATAVRAKLPEVALIPAAI